MKTITLNNFGGGMANDIYAGNSGEFSTTRNFDIFTYPNRLFPIASMAQVNVSPNTYIGNVLTAKNLSSTGAVYGFGANVALANITSTALWKNNGTWTETNTKISGQTIGDYAVFLEYNYPSATNTIITSGTSGAQAIAIHDPTDTQNPTTHSLTFTKLTCGLVHPKDNVLYIGYDNKIASKIGSGALTAAVLTLPDKYTITSLSWYGDYLAIACTYYSSTNQPGSAPDNSIVYLWDRDTSNTLPNESIHWGDNSLQILNNLNGILVGVSYYLSNEEASLIVKGYAGGAPELLKEICVVRTDRSTSPTVTIYPKVNLIHRNTLVFSADLVGGGTSPSHKGLWKFGKNKNGQWALTLSRYASTDGSDVSVLAATYWLDYLYCVHTAVGTLTQDVASNTLSVAYNDPSYWESVVNPNMEDVDKIKKKKLTSVAVHTLPLTTLGQIILKYKVDGGDWTTVFTKTSTSPDTNLVAYESNKPSSGQFTDGRNYEFRIESTGGAQVTGLTYKYEILETNI